MESSLRTTMPVDSVLRHYNAQFVAAGWTAEGKSAVTDGTAVQRYSFRENNEPWTAALIISVVGDRRDVLLRVAKLP